MSEVLTIFREPRPVEIEVEVCPEEFEALAREIQLLQPGATLPVTFDIVTDYDHISIEAFIQNEN